MSIEVKIKKKLGNFALDVDFTAGREALALLGASGCGKSMTLRCIAGIERPDQGRIVVDGEVLYDSEKRIDLPPQKRKVGLLFQNYALFPNMTVEQNIAAGLRQKDHDRVAQYIRRFRLEGLEKQLPGQLSGGQQQRAALARMLITEPRLLMLDEPFSALDAHLRWEMEQEVMEVIRGFGGTTLLVSHDRDEVYRIAQNIAVYDHGTIDRVGDKWDLFRDPVTATAARLTGCKNITDASWADGVVTAPNWGLTLRAADSGRPVTGLGVRAHYIKGAAEPGDNVFRYEVLSAIEDTFSVILMICPQGGSREHPIRWELSKSDYAALPSKDLAYVAPEDLLLLQ
jgi:molybdate transport system ATP-binding protein